MPAAHRALVDLNTGHDCFPPVLASSGSSDVKINEKPAHRFSDPYFPHECGVCSPHVGFGSKGSSKVYINGKPARRVEDAVSCGGTAKDGASNVFIGG